LAWLDPHTNFSLYENRLKTNVDMLSAYSRTGTKFYVVGKNSLAITVLVNDKYFKMHEAAKLTLSKF
jgi:hypothetical protein